ncbi:MAG: serine hydrolase domain-containing protein [Bacteroidota bacterium]
MTIKSILPAIVLWLTLPLFSQPQQTLDPEQINQILYQHANDETPGMAVGIIQDGQIVYEQYLGYANLEHEAKVGPQTRFNIASNAKQFTALCMLKLVDEGKLKLEDDIRIYLPALFPGIEEKMTISQLITHTSGVRDYCDLLALQGESWWKQFIDNEDVIKLLESQRDLNFQPGTEFLYSNSNYILLAAIIQKVTGQKFGDYAQALFTDLGMTQTSFLTHYGKVIPHRARPYGNWDGWIQEPTITSVHGDGALFTTLSDQLKWEQIIQANDGTYLSQEILQTTQSPISASFAQDYGYGLMFGSRGEVDYAYHDGATSAYNATFLRFPKKKISIVVMGNNRNVIANHVAWQIALEIMDWEDKRAVYPGDPDKVEKLDRMQDVVGMYKGEGNDETVIKIVEKNDTLYREIYQRDPVKLLPEKEGLFEYETIEGLKMNFTNIGKSNQQFTLYKSTQKPSTYHKISDIDMGGFDKGDLNGRFYNEETDTEIILKYVKDNSYSLTKNGRERQSELIIADYLRMLSSYEIRAIRNSKDEVVGLNVANNRIKNVIFERM